MAIYDYDVNIIGKQLLPPQLRQVKMLAWIYVLLKPIQWLRDLIFIDYCDGTNYTSWSNLSGYTFGMRVIYLDKCNYECINPLGAAGNSQNPLNPDYWLKIQDNFIGVNQRIRFNSQIIILEHALNKWFRIPNAAVFQIYIVNTPLNNNMIMGNVGNTSSHMANDSVNSDSFMSNAPTFSVTDYTIYIPAAVYVNLGNNANDRESNVRQFVNKYNLTGITYTVTSY